MNQENFEKLTESLYRKGFGESLNKELEQQIQSGKADFMLEHMATIDKDEVGYRLHFRRDQENDKVYFNSYDAAIFKNADAPGLVLEHTFPSEKLITAMEAYRMLKHGELVAVNKTLFNKERQQYNTWISLDTKGQKDEHGNYPVNSYHENYFPKKLDKLFILKDELQKLSVPVKEVEVPKYLDTIEKSLKKANLVHVTIMHNGEESTGFLSVNPKAGRIDLYDRDMKLIEQQGQQQKEAVVNPAQKNEEQAQNQEDVKKKPSNDQKVNWTKSENSRKGMHQ